MPTSGLLRPTKGPFKLKRVICRPDRAVSWPGKPFVCLIVPFVGLKGASFGMKGSFRSNTFLCCPESSCDTLRGPSFGLRGPLLSHDGILSARESPVLLEGPLSA